MKRYYHKGNGEVVESDENKYPKPYSVDWTEPTAHYDYEIECTEWDNYLASLPVTHYCDPSYPVGWLPECEERYQVRCLNRWKKTSEYLYNLANVEHRRIFLVTTAR